MRPALLRVLALPPKTELALGVLAICAGAPLVPKKLIKLGGNPSFVLSQVVTTSLLAIVTVPLSLHLLAGRVAFETESVTAAGVARVILESFLVPLGAGMVVRILAPGVADRIGDVLLRVASAVMGVCALVALAVACASRHVGLALLIATTARGPHTFAYLLASALDSIPYMRWRWKLTV